METVQGGYRGKLKKENEDNDVAGDGERDIEEDWINGDRRARRKDNTRNGGRRRTDGQGGFWARRPDILDVSYFRRSAAA